MARWITSLLQAGPGGSCALLLRRAALLWQINHHGILWKSGFRQKETHHCEEKRGMYWETSCAFQCSERSESIYMHYVFYTAKMSRTVQPDNPRSDTRRRLMERRETLRSPPRTCGPRSRGSRGARRADIIPREGRFTSAAVPNLNCFLFPPLKRPETLTE